jgi:pantoate--beta-alanine ligase
MIVLEHIADVRAWRETQSDVGFVPTMGFLHDGHISLVEQARRENEAVAASIFVNPSQFGPDEDLEAYPRDLPRDLRLLEEAGCDMVFVPRAEEIYRPGHQTWIEVESVAAPLEGARRPGHFRGVATIVAKLFGIVQPHRAYFGQKDAQQLAVIRTMTSDLDMPVTIVGCPTVREADGLAMSSRNTYLNPQERESATVLYRALTAARDAWLGGETDADALRMKMLDVLRGEPLAQVDYVSVADPLTMEELTTATEGALLSMAVQVGPARLIDNMLLEHRRDGRLSGAVDDAVPEGRPKDAANMRGAT